MEYKKKMNIDGVDYEYVGKKIPLYGLTPLTIDYAFIELINSNAEAVEVLQPSLSSDEK